MKINLNWIIQKLLRNTNNGNLTLCKPNTTIIKLFYIYKGIRLYNALHNYIKSINKLIII